MPSYLFAADLHVTDRPVDEYRWAAFDFIENCARRKNPDAIILGGDITDAKDRHSARLVRRVLDQVDRLSQNWSLFWVMGNHDYRDRGAPFFEFIDRMPNVFYTSKPEIIQIESDDILCIPHTRSWAPGESWRRDYLRHRGYSSVIAHQTFKGAKASNGEYMNGPPLSALSERVLRAPVFAGDIHVPQNLGNITYVGSPHSVNFGDHFDSRILFVNGRTYEEIPNKASPVRWKLRVTPEELDRGDWMTDVYEADQVKVELRLTAAEALDASQYRDGVQAAIEAAGAEWHGTSIKVEQAKPRRARLFSRVEQDQGGNSPAAVLAQYGAHRKLEPEVLSAMESYL